MTQFKSFSWQIHETISELQQQLDDLSLKQQELHKLITNSRNDSLTEEEYADVKLMMEKTSSYNSKLLSIRTTMVNMSLKSKQLRKRSDKLKATKLDYLSKVEGIRKLEQERDLSIAAKVSDPVDDQQQQQQQRVSLSSSPSSSPINISSPKIMDTPEIATATMNTDEKTAAQPTQLTSIQRTASTLSITPTGSPSSPLSPSESVSSTSAALAKKKKKKKPKAREVEIGGDDDGRAWIPKRTLSTTKKP